MRYNGVLKLADFSDPRFTSEMREVFPHFASAWDDYPNGRESAKAWEITQAARGLNDFGALRPDAELLGVAAGFEHTVFYLTNHVKRVFATDLYATNKDWKEADSGMLLDPTPFATPNSPWQPNRLVVQHMDALNLRYEDGSFDGIFSCGSIEHFGTLENVAQAAHGMARVLKPGGVLTLSTEFRISGPEGLGIPGAILFTREMIEQYVIAASGLTLVDELQTETSPETVAEAYPLMWAIENGVRSRSVALTHDDYTWTSISLCLQKPL